MGQTEFARANAEVPIAWPDDDLTFTVEKFSETSIEKLPASKREEFRTALNKAITELKARTANGKPPQLRMALASGDNIGTYLDALGNSAALHQLRYRAAVALWNSGGATMAGGPRPQQPRRPPREAYLQMMAKATPWTKPWHPQGSSAVQV